MSIVDVVNSELREIEIKHNIRIIYACENGSRNWGMESDDSDYDIRFIFTRPSRYYLEKIITQKDALLLAKHQLVIIEKKEHSIGDLDFQGWDIYKARTMLIRSNSALIEWLTSDIIYRDYGGDFIIQLYEVGTTGYNPLALAHHYRNMGKHNFMKYIKKGSDVCYKRYLYAFRGLFNAMWVVFNKSLPPVHFKDAVKLSNFLPVDIKKVALDVIEHKRTGLDRDQIEPIEVFDDYLIEQFKLFEIPNDIGHRVELSREFDESVATEVFK